MKTLEQLGGDIRYAIRLCGRTARLYRCIQSAGTFFSLVGGSADLSGAAGQLPAWVWLSGIALLALAGCAIPYTWVKYGVTTEAYEQGLARCRYEAVAATAGYSSGRVAPTMGGAIAQGLGEGMAIGLRQAELFALCLEANGYTKQLTNHRSPASYASAPAPVAAPPPVPPLTTVAAKKVEPVPAKRDDTGATLSETARVVQVLADSGFPLVGTPARFMQKENRSYYEAWGTGGRLTHVVCENTACRIRSIYD